MIGWLRRRSETYPRARDLPGARDRLLGRRHEVRRLRPRRGDRVRCSPACSSGRSGSTISSQVKSIFFIMFLFAVGYGVGPQFVRGIANDGAPQALFAVVQCVLCLAASPSRSPKSRATAPASPPGCMPARRRSRRRWASRPTRSTGSACPPEQAKAELDRMPVAYAVTYLFGTSAPAISSPSSAPSCCASISRPRARTTRRDARAAPRRWAARLGWHRWELRAFRVKPGGKVVGMRVAEAEALLPDARVFVERLRRDGG